MIVTVARVGDLDQFLRTFATKGVEKRREHGCRGAHVYRDPQDPEVVWVFFDWDRADYDGFLTDPEVPDIARELALRAPPVEPEALGHFDS